MWSRKTDVVEIVLLVVSCGRVPMVGVMKLVRLVQNCRLSEVLPLACSRVAGVRYVDAVTQQLTRLSTSSLPLVRV